MPTKHIVISGKVQGVFYRASAKGFAAEQGITGWISNTESGDVECVATGSPEQLEAFVEWCWKGPTFASVANVTATDTAEQVFTSFSIKH